MTDTLTENRNKSNGKTNNQTIDSTFNLKKFF